jgi:hypothetical protein
MQRKLVYIASPYEGDVEANILFTQRAGVFAVKQGVTPYIPNFTVPILTDTSTDAGRELGNRINADMLNCCDELWIFTERGLTDGMIYAQTTAANMGIPIVVVPDLIQAETTWNPAITAKKNELNDLRRTLGRDVQDAALEKLWDEFKDVPFENNAPNTGSTRLAKQWRWFPAGTTRREIQNWFSSRHSVGMVYLMEKDLMYVEESTIYGIRALEQDCQHRFCKYNKKHQCTFAKENGRPARQTYAEGCIDISPEAEDA